MDLVALSKRRVESVLREIDRISSSEFPYDAAQDALSKIRDLFIEDQGNLKLISTAAAEPIDHGVRDLLCENVLTHLSEYLPLLGFILRSTNVRNAFELHAPLTRLSKQIVTESTRLVLTSEWEYSPLVFMEAPRLKEFIFVGFPAHESGNPFIFPLAGHELGHAAWTHDANDLWRVSFERDISNAMVEALVGRIKTFHVLYPDHKNAGKTELAEDWVVKQAWSPAFDWAKCQCEEYFCDFFAIRLFGESYLQAFAYLLSPRVHGERPVFYPNMTRRVQTHVLAANYYGVAVPKDYVEAFADLSEPSDGEAHKQFLLEVADQAVETMIDELISHADSLLGPPISPAWKVKNPSAGQLRKDGYAEPAEIANPEIGKRILIIRQDFESVAPAQNSGGITFLLNAGWQVFLSDQPLLGVELSEREATLRELLLKSLEVLEYESRTVKGNDT